jgi:hypothetical protein
MTIIPEVVKKKFLGHFLRPTLFNFKGERTMYVKQCVCLKNCLCMLYDPGSLGRPWAQFWTTIGPTVDLSKSASRTQKNVLNKQISCLCES